MTLLYIECMYESHFMNGGEHDHGHRDVQGDNDHDDQVDQDDDDQVRQPARSLSPSHHLPVPPHTHKVLLLLQLTQSSSIEDFEQGCTALDPYLPAQMDCWKNTVSHFQSAQSLTPWLCLILI